jgi:hypothetical protein
MSHFDQLTKNKQNNNEKKAEKEKRKCEGGIYIFIYFLLAPHWTLSCHSRTSDQSKLTT